MSVRDSIINAIGAQTGSLDPIKVPDQANPWPAPLWLRNMSAMQRDNWEIGWLRWRRTQNGDAEDVRFFDPYLLIHTLCDSQGGLMFTENDVRTLGNAAAAVVTRLSRLAMRINGIGKDDVDELLKNCESSPSESSGTDSPSSSGGGQ